MLCSFCWELLQLTVCCFVCLAPIVYRYSSLLASMGLQKTLLTTMASQMNCCNIIILLHSLCIDDKMEPCSDVNSLMWCIMHVQCTYGVRYILSWIDAGKSINRCLCLHPKHLNRCIVISGLAKRHYWEPKFIPEALYLRHFLCVSKDFSNY